MIMGKVEAVLPQDGAPLFALVAYIVIEVAKLRYPLGFNEFAHLVQNGFFLGCRGLKCVLNIKATARLDVLPLVLCFARVVHVQEVTDKATGILALLRCRGV